MKIVYIAGRFRGDDAWAIRCHVHAAECAAREVARCGAMPLTPHSIGAHMHGTESADFWLEGTLELMRRSDIVLVLPGFERSVGSLGEIGEARYLRIPVILPLLGDLSPNYRQLIRWIGYNSKASISEFVSREQGSILDQLGLTINCNRIGNQTDQEYRSSLYYTIRFNLRYR